MTTRFWVRKLFARPAGTIRKAAVGSRPRLEALEDRTLLNTYFAATAADLITDIGLANAAGGSNTITLSAAPSSPYTLTAVDNSTDGATGLPVIAAGDNLTIVGNGDTIGRSTAAGTPAFRLFDVAAGATLTLQNLTLTNGVASGSGVSGQGGAIYSQGALTLNGVSVQNNTAQGINGVNGTAGGIGGNGSNAFGGGLYLAGGSGTLTNDRLSGNIARGGGGGNGGNAETGGAGGSGGKALGGGLYVAQASVTLTNDTLSGNSAQGGGGGAGGGLGSYTAGNGGGGGDASGGGLCVAGGPASLTNDTLSGNSAQGGGGGSGGGNLGATTGGNGGNGGNGSGGGLYVAHGTVTLTNTLIAQDTLVAGTAGRGGYGIFLGNKGNPGSASAPDVSGSVSSSDHDLVGDGTGSNLSNGVNADQVGTSASPINPLLGPLQDNGGPTPTMALLLDSPAIDAGDSTAPGLPSTDQRGFARISGAAVDIGAFEVEHPALSSATPPAGTYGTAYSQTITATEPGYQGAFTFAVTAGTLPTALSLASDGTLSGTPTAAGTFSFTVTAADSAGLTGSQSYTVTIDKATLTVTANNASRSCGVANPAFTYSITGFVNNDPASVVSGTPILTTTATASSAPGQYTISVDLSSLSAANYTFQVVNGTLTVTPALSATAVNFSTTAGAPFSGTVATFTTADKTDSAAAFTAVITWGDGSTSTGVITASGGSFTVCGSHTYSAAGSYAVSVQISNPKTQSATVNDTATVTSLAQGVVAGLTAGIGFWHNTNGQALIKSFNGGSSSTALGNWLAASFPNLYGAGTGSNNLAGKSNAQVAAYFQSLFNQGGTQAQVLAVALNVYATTTSLGGNAGASYGFTVSATGLGARSFNLGQDGAAFGVANNSTLSVYALLAAVNKQMVNGVLYGGNATLQARCADLFSALDQAGGIG
jgi:hypothetical protein